MNKIKFKTIVPSLKHICIEYFINNPTLQGDLVPKELIDMYMYHVRYRCHTCGKLFIEFRYEEIVDNNYCSHCYEMEDKNLMNADMIRYGIYDKDVPRGIDLTMTCWNPDGTTYEYNPMNVKYYNEEDKRVKFTNIFSSLKRIHEYISKNKNTVFLGEVHTKDEPFPEEESAILPKETFQDIFFDFIQN